MNNLLRSSGLAVALALAPLAASAATLNPGNTLVSEGEYDIAENPYYFGVSFTSADVGGSYFFDFFNDSVTSVALSVAVSTINQLALQFTGGGMVSWSGGESMTFAEGSLGDVLVLGTTLDRGETERLEIMFGDPSPVTRFGTTFDGQADIDLTVISTPSAVPVPAAGLLLLSALGGIAALRRRKTV